MPTIAGSHGHGGMVAIRTSFAYGKLDTIASASTAIATTETRPGSRSPMRIARLSTAAAIVVGTPQKNRPSLGETLNRASRIAAQVATSAQAPATRAPGAL